MSSAMFMMRNENYGSRLAVPKAEYVWWFVCMQPAGRPAGVH